MPDQVHCTSDSSHSFTCEVLIGPEPEPEPEPEPTNAASATPASVVPGQAPRVAPDPAVLAPRQVYEQISLPAPEVPYITGQALMACAGNELSILLAGIAKGPLAALVAFKAGYDAGKCLASEHNAASAAAARKEAADDCAARGGTVISVVDDRSVCEVPTATEIP